MSMPADPRLILREELSPGERRWLDAYHADVLEKLLPHTGHTPVIVDL